MESSIFKPLKPISGSEWKSQKKFLSSTLGSACPFVVCYQENVLHVYHLELNKKVYSFEFPESVKVVDVDNFPSKDGSFGLLVAAQDEHLKWGAENYIVGLEAGPGSQVNLKLKWSLGIPEQITVVKTLFTNQDMYYKATHFNLFSKLEKWPHIVAIGAINSRCYIGKLQEHDDVDSETVLINMISQNYVDIFSSFRSKSRNTFTYSYSELSKTYHSSAISVTSLALLPRSRTLLVGLSTGGIISAALNPSNAMTQLELRHERSIHQLVPLEPEDDPEKYEYFMAIADGSQKHAIMIHLWRGCFKTGDNMDAVAERQFDEPLFYVNMEHRIPFGKRWICAKTMTHDRLLGGVNLNKTRRNNLDSSMSHKSPNASSMLNCSQTLGSSLNRSSILLVYEKLDVSTNQSLIEAAVFDIDAYYYKRMPGTIRDDQTCLRQSPFMSNIRSFISPEDVEDVSIILDVSTDISRFTSPISDADQLFYPSSLNFERVFVATSEVVNKTQICSVQDAILNDVSENLENIIDNAHTVAEKLVAAGFVSKTFLHGSPNSSMNSSQLSGTSYWSIEQKIVLTTMLYYGKIDSLIKLAESRELSSEIKMQIAEWVYFECCNFRKTILDRTYSVFEGSSEGLSPLAESALNNGLELFYMCENLFSQYHKALQHDGDQNIRNIKKFAEHVHYFWIYSRLIRQFVSYGIIPTNNRISRKMKERHEQKVDAASRNKCAIPVQLVVRRMNMTAPGAGFWDEIPYDQWYPPHPSNLLDPVLAPKISEKLKRELVINYVLDWIRASENVTNDEAIARKAHRIISDQLMGSDFEKIMYILEQEKEAIKEKPSAQVFKTVENIDLEKKDTVPESLSGKKQEVFENRYRMQKENSSLKLPTLSEEDEKLYQGYLLCRQRYGYLSEETVKSNKLLRTFLSSKKIGSQSGGQNDKTEKQKDIENAVKNMFQKNKSNSSESVIMPVSVFETMAPAAASVAQKVQQMHIGRKRRSLNVEASDAIEPPSSKRVASQKSPEITTHVEGDSTDDDEIFAAAQTPAKYLSRKPIRETELSPEFRLAPPTTCPNSILKSAKTAQSPSRGRIRFHKSVVGFDGMEEESADEGSVRSLGKKLNFDFEDDDDDDFEVSATESKKQPEELFEVRVDAPTPFEDIERTVEFASEYSENMEVVEKEVEAAEKEVEVAEKEVEKTSEIADELVEPQVVEMEEENVMETTLEIAEEPEEVENIEKSFEIAEERQEVEEEKSSEIAEEKQEEEAKNFELVEEGQEVEEEKSFEIAEEVEEVEKEKEEKVVDNATFVIEKEEEVINDSEKEEDVGDNATIVIETEKEKAEIESEMQDEFKDGIERSFELQKDEDVEPMEVVEEEKKEEEKEVVTVESVEQGLRKSARKRTPSRSRTVSVTEERQESVDPPPTKTKPTRSRTNSVSQQQKTEIAPTTTKRGRTPRSRTVSRAEEVEEEPMVVETPTPVRARTRSASRTRNTSVAPEHATPKKASSKVISETVEPEVVTPKRGRPPKADLQKSPARSSTRVRAQSVTIPEEPESSTPKKAAAKPKTGSTTRGRSRTVSEQIVTEEPTPKKGRRAVSKSPARGKIIEEEEDEEEPATTSRASRATSASRVTKSKVEDVVVAAGSRSRSRTRAASEMTTKPKTGGWRDKVYANLEKVDPKAAQVARSVSASMKPSSEAPLTPRRSARRLQ